MTYGVVNDFVLYRAPYVSCCVVLGGFVGKCLWDIWFVDVLKDRSSMLQITAKFDLVAALMCCGYVCLKGNQIIDSLSTKSDMFYAVSLQGGTVPVVFACVGVLLLLFVFMLWITAPNGGDLVNPLQIAHLRKLQFWNLVCAGVGLAGPPLLIPCLVSSILGAATISSTLK